jgi:hypothetical protein
MGHDRIIQFASVANHIGDPGERPNKAQKVLMHSARLARAQLSSVLPHWISPTSFSLPLRRTTLATLTRGWKAPEKYDVQRPFGHVQLSSVLPHEVSPSSSSLPLWRTTLAPWREAEEHLRSMMYSVRLDITEFVERSSKAISDRPWALNFRVLLRLGVRALAVCFTTQRGRCSPDLPPSEVYQLNR